MTETPYTEGPYNPILAKLRLLAMAVFIVALVALARPTVVSVVCGLVFVIAGESVRFWAAGHLFKTRELITSGPYRYTRNPLYLGRLLIFTGVAVMALLPYGLNWVILVLGWPFFFFVYLRRKERVEPARLLRFHGEAYQRYFEAVPALFPTARPFSGEGSQGEWKMERMLRNREYMMVLGLTLFTAFLLWRALTPV